MNSKSNWLSTMRPLDRRTSSQYFTCTRQTHMSLPLTYRKLPIPSPGVHVYLHLSGLQLVPSRPCQKMMIPAHSAQLLLLQPVRQTP